MTDRDSDTEAAELDRLLGDLHAVIAATEEVPVRPRANRWLGEAQAVASDVAGGAPREAVVRRVAQVRHLLEQVDGTGSDEADERVEAAIELTARIERSLGERE